MSSKSQNEENENLSDGLSEDLGDIKRYGEKGYDLAKKAYNELNNSGITAKTGDNKSELFDNQKASIGKESLQNNRQSSNIANKAVDKAVDKVVDKAGETAEKIAEIAAENAAMAAADAATLGLAEAGRAAVKTVKLGKTIRDHVTNNEGKSLKDVIEGAAKDSEGKRKKDKGNTFIAKAVVFVVVPITIVCLIIFLPIFLIIKMQSLPISMAKELIAGYGDPTGLEADLGHSITEATPEEIYDLYCSQYEEAIKTAYTQTSYQELLQIIEERNYKADMTIDSYKGVKCPYIFVDEGCNINYLELLTLYSMSLGRAEDHGAFDWDYQAYKEMFEDKEFLRCLYNLKVEDVVELRIPYTYTDEHGNVLTEMRDAEWEWVDYEHQELIYYDQDGQRHSGRFEKGDLITDESGATGLYYGSVNIDKYTLAALFDYYGLNPNDMNPTNPILTNMDFLGYSCSLSNDSEGYEFGSKIMSSYLEYERLTGEITKDDINNGDYYFDDFLTSEELRQRYKTTPEGYTLINQGAVGGSFNLGGKTYTMKQAGCCICSVAMVIDYLYNDSNKADLHYIETHWGEKGAADWVKSNGCVEIAHSEYTGSSSDIYDTGKLKGKQKGLYSFREKEFIEALNTSIDGEKKSAIMVHISPYTPMHPNGGSGHWVVFVGYDPDKDMYSYLDPNGGVVREVPWENISNSCNVWKAYQKAL